MLKSFKIRSTSFILASLFALAAVAGGAACSSSNDNPPVVDKGDSSVDSSTSHDNNAKQLHADLGTCVLESGETIKNCTIGYQTFGTPNADGSNLVLWPTWFTGRTASLVDLVPKGGDNNGVFIDTEKYFVVLVDSLGDGISSSPSNSAPGQERLQFPIFNIRDMVNTQYKLVTGGYIDGLNQNITRIKAVAGISMGGMQAIQWSVSYPNFMDKIVAIVGSPKLTSQDMLLWTADLRALQNDPEFKGGNYVGQPVFRTTYDILNLVLTTPKNQVETVTPEGFQAWLKGAEDGTATAFDGNDWHRQLEAMMAHDVSATPDVGSIDAAAQRVKAKSLYMVSTQDHVVNPIPTRDFADRINKITAGTVTVNESNSQCGHIAAQSKNLGPQGNPCGIAEDAGKTVDDFLSLP